MGRAPCCSQHSTLNRGAWTAHEDYILAQYIKIHGEGGWRSLPQKAGLKRCGKSCRIRWFNYLHPDVKRGNISADEEDLILRLHGLLGNRWALIAGRLPGRTGNEIKNYWNTYLSKKETLSKTKTKSKLVHPASDPVWKSNPVKNTSVRIENGPNRYASCGKANHQDLNSQIKKISKSWCQSLVDEWMKEYNSQNVEISIVESGFPSPCYSIQDFHMDEVEQASLPLEINVKQANTFIEEQEMEEMKNNTQLPESQDLQRLSIEWLSMLLLESEED